MPVNSVEPVRNYPTPNEANDVSYDFPRLRTAITMIGSDVGALLASVAGKSSVGHGHAIADVSGLGAALDGKSNVGHTHALGALTDVNLSGAASGQFLGLVSGTWQPVTITPAGIEALAASAATATGLSLLGATDVPAARTALGLGSWALLSAARATSGDANAAIGAATFLHAVTASLTAPRTLTLPLANANSLPYIIVVDEARGVSATNTLTIQTAGGDLVNGVSNIVLNTPGASAIIARNGTDRWTALSTGGGGGNTFTAYRYNATGTTISGADLGGASLSYTPGLLLVMVNGAALRSEEYTATNGTSITISTLVSGDEVMVVAFSSFTVANALRIDGGNTPTANIPMGGFRLTNLGLASAGTDALSRNAGDARYPSVSIAQSFTAAEALQGRANIGANPSLARTITSASTAGERTLTAADCGRLIILSGTTNFTLTIDPAASLGNGWSFNFKQAGRCIVTVDPNASEQIDGATTIALLFRQQGTIVCTGSAFETSGVQKMLVIESQDISGTTQADFQLPPGYENFRALINYHPSTTANGINARVSTDGGSTFNNSAGAYITGVIFPASTSTISQGFSTSANAIPIWSDGVNAERLQGIVVDIFNARNASARTVFSAYGFGERVGAGRGPQMLGGNRDASEDNNAIRFFCAVNMTARITLIGVQP